MKMGADPLALDKRMAAPRDYVQAKRLTWALTEDEIAALDHISRLLRQERQPLVIESGEEPAFVFLQFALVDRCSSHFSILLLAASYWRNVLGCGCRRRGHSFVGESCFT